MKFISPTIKMNKGNMKSYFSLINKEQMKDLDVSLGEALLIKHDNNIFPTVLRTYGGSKNIYGFNIPSRYANHLDGNRLEFDLFSKSFNKNGDKDINGFINLLSLIPAKTVKNNTIFSFDLNDKAMFWIYSKGNKPYTLPKFISFSKNDFSLFELVGIFICEGFKARYKNKNLDRLSISNADKKQIEWTLNAFEKLLLISKKEWNVQILYNGKENEKVTDYWLELGLNKAKIKVVKNKKVSEGNGVCILNIFNSSLAEVFYYIVEHMKSVVLRDKIHSLEMFRGFSRGDIGVSGRCISFDTEKEDDVILFKNVCKNLSIKTSKLRFNENIKGWWNVTITHRDNFEKILKMNGIEHTDRKLKLIRTFLKNKNNRFYKYLFSVANGYNTSVKAVRFLNRSVITTRFYLAKLAKNGYLYAENKIENGKIVYQLTAKGKDELDFYLSLRKQIGD